MFTLPHLKEDLHCHADYQKFECRRSVSYLLTANDLIHHYYNDEQIWDEEEGCEFNRLICQVWLGDEPVTKLTSFHKASQFYKQIQTLLWENIEIETAEKENDRASGCFKTRQCLRTTFDERVAVLVWSCVAFFFIRPLAYLAFIGKISHFCADWRKNFESI